MEHSSLRLPVLMLLPLLPLFQCCSAGRRAHPGRAANLSATLPPPVSCCFCCCTSPLQDVLGILVELGAMEEPSLRLLPLGLVARSINCNNELWMAAALSSPSVINLTPPQLAALVGALQCTDLLKRPMSIWSSYQVRVCLVRMHVFLPVCLLYFICLVLVRVQ
jgi:hypothetical protein